MVMRAFVGGLAMVALAGAAAATPGDPFDSGHDEAPLTILDPATAAPCPQKPGICINAGARSTIAVAAAPMAAAAGSADKSSKAAIVVPRFSRAASVAASDGTQTAAALTPPENAAWTLALSGTLKHPAWAGNALFLFFDLEDPDSIENRQFTALYQAPLKAGPKLAARLVLSPEDGFRPGHSYRIRVVQLINAKEIVLGETDVSLL